MKIAHVTATFPPYEGGTGNVCFHNALTLAKLGHDVTVFTGTASYNHNFDKQFPFTVKRLPALISVGNAPLLPGLLTLKDYEIIHLHHPFIFGAELIWLISRLKKIPYVLTHHNDLIGNGFRRYLFDSYSAISTRLVFFGASRLLALSKDHAAGCRLSPLFKRRWDDVVDLPNGVDSAIYRPLNSSKEVRARYQIPDLAKVVLFVGGLDRAHHFKGIFHLMRAFAQLADPDAYLMIVGEGDLKNQYEVFSENLGIKDRTIFPGRIENHKLPPIYSAVDIAVLPSFPPESFGLVLIEAMACGKPVIASRLPGVRTVVHNGVDGFLVEPGNVEELAKTLACLLADSQLREEMGKNGRAKVVEKYDWSNIGRQLENVYADVIVESHRSA